MPSPLPPNPPERAYGTVPAEELEAQAAIGSEENPIEVAIEAPSKPADGTDSQSEGRKTTKPVKGPQKPAGTAAESENDGKDTEPDVASASDSGRQTSATDVSTASGGPL